MHSSIMNDFTYRFRQLISLLVWVFITYMAWQYFFQHDELSVPATSPPPVIPKEIMPEEVTPVIKDTRINTVRRYEVTWAKIHVADLFLEIISPEDTMHSEVMVMIRTYNLAKLASKYKSETKATLLFLGDELYRQVDYYSHYHRRKDDRTITFTYSPDGQAITKETNIPPEKRWKRKAIDEKLKTGTLNPIALGFVARQRLIHLASVETSLEGKTFTLPLYDGRRLGNFHFSIHGKTKDNLYHISYVEKPVAGYTDNELERFSRGETIIHIYVSPDDFIPVRAKGESFLGTATAQLAATCPSLETCRD